MKIAKNRCEADQCFSSTGTQTLVIEVGLKMRISVWRHEMIMTVHEDDLVAWYLLSPAIRGISIHDFELEDDDLLPDAFLLHGSDGGETAIQDFLSIIDS